jgi:hypothetical protein
MRRFKKRKHRDDFGEDPLDGVANLFDVAMVFSVALMVAIVQRMEMTEFFSQEDFTIVKNPGTENMQIIQKKDGEILHYESKASNNADESGDKGKKVGTAYQLENGEILYIPD